MTQAAKQCREYIEAKYPGVRISRKKCKDTTSGGISQHSAYQGGRYDSNALDIMGGPIGWTWDQNVELIQIIVDDLTLYLPEWSIRKILWLSPAHFGHAHIDFLPMIAIHKWCDTRNVTPPWRYSDGTTITTRNPQPENGPYEGEPDMTIADLITDATWAQWYTDGHISGDPAVMPGYYFADGGADESEKINGFNVAQRSLSRAKALTLELDTETVTVVKTVKVIS